MKAQIENSIITGLIILLLMATVLQGFGQEAQKSGKAFGGIGYFQTGYSFYNFNALNDLLKGSGIPSLNNGFVSLGGGGHSVISNFILGGEGHGLMTGVAENSQFRLRQAGGYGFFNMGYLIVNTPAAKIYPMIGLGGGSITISITDKTTLPLTFGDVMSDPGRQSHIYTGGFMMNFSLSADLFFLGEKNEKATGGFLVGMRAGYTLDVSGHNWYMDEIELTNPPDVGMSGPFVRLTIGGGGITR